MTSGRGKRRDQLGRLREAMQRARLGYQPRPACKPCLRLSIQPINGFDVGLECINAPNGAIRPFSFDGPLVAVVEHHAKDGLADRVASTRCFATSASIPPPRLTAHWSGQAARGFRGPLNDGRKKGPNGRRHPAGLALPGV